MKLLPNFRPLILSLIFLSSLTAFGQGTIPTVGKEFWMGFMNNYDPSPTLQLFISAPVNTAGTVDVPLQGWSQNFTVTANVVTTVVIPANIGEHVLNDVVDTRGVHITTDDSVSVFAINFAPYSSDGSKVLPIRSIGTEYIVSTYQGIGFAGNNLASEFLIVATEDNTEIEIIPSTLTAGGHAAGVPYIIQLDQGQSYQVKAASNSTDLTGTFITGTAASGPCRPFAVYAGTECTNIPNGCTYCDHICDQLLPSPTWGTNYYTVPFQGASGYTYQVLARENNTQVSIDGGAPITLNAGQATQFNQVATAVEVIGSQPIAVTQFMQGVSCSVTGDPAMLVLNADDQKISNVTFSTVTSAVITNHKLNVIVETIDVGTVVLDGVPIPAGNFSTYAANPANSWATVNLTQGSHNLQAPNGFSAYVYGTGNAESYAYSVGSFQPEPPLLVDSAICSNDTVLLSPPVTLFSPEWTTMSDTTTVIGTQNTLTLIPPIVNDIYIVSGNSLVSGCTQEYLYSVAVPDAPIIDAIASEDTVCMFNNVQMDVTVDPPGFYSYSWSPAYYFDNPSSQTPVLTAMNSGWFYVTVSSAGSSCSSATDSVYIHVDGGGIASVDPYSDAPNICVGDSSQLHFDVTQIAYFDDFNGGNDPNLWSNLEGYQNTNMCGALTGDALFFDGAPNRIAETTDMNTLQGGTIEFSIKIANGAAPCEDADPGEDVILQYSNTGGAPWTPITTLFESAYPNLTLVSVPIPVGAQTASTRFRWIQPTFTAAGEDVWMLENVSFQLLDNTGFTFNWTPSASLDDPASFDPMSGPIVDTWYVVEVAQGQCVYSDSVLVDVSDFTVDAGQDTVLCTTIGYQLDATTDAVNPVYSWDNGTYLNDPAIEDPVMLVDSTLSFILSVDNGTCSISDTVNVTLVNSNAVPIPDDTTICFGQNVTLDLSTLSNITWTPTTGITNPTSTSPIFSPANDQLYYVEYMTQEGCYLEDSIQFYVTPLPVVTISNDTTVCIGAPVTIQSNVNVPNPDYLWSTNDTIPSITVNTAGTYWLTITTECGSSTDSIVISNFPGFTNDLGPDTTLCDYDQLVLAPTIPAGGTILWTGGSTNPTYTVTTPSTVWSEITDIYNCTLYDTIVVGYHPVTNVSAGPDLVICEYDTVTVDATVAQGDIYEWNNGDMTAETEISAGGQYWVQVTDIFGCVFSDTMNVSEILAPTPTILGQTQYCDIDTVTYTVDQPYNAYNWYLGSDSSSTTLSGPHGMVWVQVTGANNCIGYDTLMIEMVPTPSIDLEDEVHLCDTNLVEITAYLENADYYQWDNGMQGPTVIVEEGTYVVEAFAICAVYDTVTVTQGKVDFTLGPDQHVCDDDVIFIAPKLYSLDSLIWYNGQESNFFTYEDKFYIGDTIEISAMAYGCGDTGDTVLFFIDDCNCPIFVPNSFTPNGDEYNNHFEIEHECLLEEFEFVIYNRWGQTIFVSYDSDFVWDGTYNGKFVQDGVYVWKMRYRYAYDIEKTEVKTRTGHISVLR